MARRRRASSAPLRGSISGLLLAVTVLGAHAALAAAAAPGSILAPTEGEVLTAGASHVVRWSSLPSEVDEFEILLSLDGGSSYPIRLTPQLDPVTGAHLWRVPDLPARDARLRLRWGIAGREIDGPSGSSFTIDAHTWRATSGLTWRNGEWWLTAHPSLVGLQSVSAHWRERRRPSTPPTPLASPQRSQWDPCPSDIPVRNAACSAELVVLRAPERSGSRRPIFSPLRC